MNNDENKVFYRPPDKTVWQGRVDNELKERFFQIVDFPDYHPIKAPQKTIALIGFACDEGVRRNQGREGAAQGPISLRESLANYPLHGQANHLQLLDLGDILCPNSQLEKAQLALGNKIEAMVDQNVFTIVLGGGHETAFGHYLGLRKKWGKSNFAIVNFDAHFDMRPLLNDQQGTSGSPFLQIATTQKNDGQAFHYYCIGINPSRNTKTLFEMAKKWQVNYLTVDEIYASKDHITIFLEKIIAQHDYLYVSLCLDVFAENVAPGVSSTSPYGLDPWQVLSGVKQLALSKKVIALDVVELAPCFDREKITSKLGALCICEFLYHQKIGGAT